MARGVQGMIDLTVPGGGRSPSTLVMAPDKDVPAESNEAGSIKRMLEESGKAKCSREESESS